MIFRYLIEIFPRAEEEQNAERLRELGLESWELVSVQPGTQKDPTDGEHVTCWFKKDASTDIGL